MRQHWGCLITSAIPPASVGRILGFVYVALGFGGGAAIATIAALSAQLLYYELLIVGLLHLWALSAPDGWRRMLATLLIGGAMSLVLLVIGASPKSIVKLYCLFAALILPCGGTVLGAFMAGSVTALALLTSTLSDLVQETTLSEDLGKLSNPFFPILAAIAFVAGRSVLGICLVALGMSSGAAEAYRGLLVSSVAALAVPLLRQKSLSRLGGVVIGFLPLIAVAVSPLVLLAIDQGLIEPTASNVERIGTNILSILFLVENGGWPGSYESSLEFVNEFQTGEGFTSPHNFPAEFALAGGAIGVALAVFMCARISTALWRSQSYGEYYLLVIIAILASVNPFNFWARHAFYLAAALSLFRTSQPTASGRRL